MPKLNWGTILIDGDYTAPELRRLRRLRRVIRQRSYITPRLPGRWRGMSRPGRYFRRSVDSIR